MLARRALGLHIQEPELPGIGAALQIPAGGDVCVVPARSRGARHDCIPPRAMWRDHGRALFLRAVDLGRDEQTVPMHDLRRGVSLCTSTVMDWPSCTRSTGPGTDPLYPVVLIVRRGAISISTGEMRSVISAFEFSGVDCAACVDKPDANRARKSRRSMAVTRILCSL